MKQIKGKKLKKSSLLIAAAAVGVCVLCVGSVMLHPLHLKNKIVQVEIDEPFDPRDNILYILSGTLQDVKIQGKADTSVPGDYPLEYVYKNKVYPAMVRVADFTPPILVLKPVRTTVEEEVDAESFVEKIEDSSKVSLTITNPENLKNEAGTRDITITAMDEFGNKTTRHTQLTRGPDTQSPHVLNTQAERYVLQNDVFTPLELEIEDDTDPSCEVEVDVGDLDMTVCGEYTIMYTIWDKSGNTTIWTEVVHVTDQLPASRSAAEQDKDPQDPPAGTDDQ